MAEQKPSEAVPADPESRTGWAGFRRSDAAGGKPHIHRCWCRAFPKSAQRLGLGLAGGSNTQIPGPQPRVTGGVPWRLSPAIRMHSSPRPSRVTDSTACWIGRGLEMHPQRRRWKGPKGAVTWPVLGAPAARQPPRCPNEGPRSTRRRRKASLPRGCVAPVCLAPISRQELPE